MSDIRAPRASLKYFWIAALGTYLLTTAFALSAPPASASHSGQGGPASYRHDRILVRTRQGAKPSEIAALHASHGAKLLGAFKNPERLQVISVPPGETVQSLCAKYDASGSVEYAEPDFIRHLDSTFPNDPYFANGSLWGLYNYGQNGGTPHADIAAPAAWDVLTSASNVIVAVLDSGIRYTHEDLAANMWSSPIDGSHGLNAIAGNNEPADDNGHGTLMAGIIGGVGNNAKGVTGVAWRCQLMAGKCFDSGGTASDSAILACLDFARTNGARIVNGSFSGPGFSQSLSNALYSLRDAGVIFVGSAGNANPGVNIDVTPYYPAAYLIDNIVSVAYTTRTDALGFLSNYGATNVDLAAPGDQIFSTYSSSDSAYYPTLSFINVAGTSFAAAYVSGALALAVAKHPAESHQAIISRLLKATDAVPGLTGKCATGGRLNLNKLLNPPVTLTLTSSGIPAQLQLRVGADPNRTFTLQSSADLGTWSTVLTNVTSESGTFDILLGSPATPQNFYRVLANL